MSAAAIAEAEARYRAGNHAAAAAMLGKLAAAEPPDPTALRLLGLCRLRLGDLPGSLALLRQAHGLAPQDPWCTLHLGIGLQTAGRHAEALPLLRAAAGSLPADPAPLINLSNCLLALDDAQGALRAASEACFRAPQAGEAHYTYGLAWLALREWSRAAESFAAATRLLPGLAEAWLNLGLASYHAGNMDAARAATAQALRLVPGHRAATGNLAVFLRLTGNADGAERLLRDLLARDPGAPEARINLAAELLQEERPAAALAMLDPAMLAQPLPAPAHRQWLAQRALALIQLGRTGEARAELAGIGDPPPGLAPMVLFRHVLLAAAEGDAADARAAAGRMEAALADAGAALVPEHHIMAHFDLAKFWSTQGEPHRAFPHWVSGHRLLGRLQPFDRDVYRGFVDASIEMFGRERLQHGPRAGNTSPLPVFIVGMPRSGTTLCEQILAAHAQVHGAGERNALAAAFAAMGGTAETAEAARAVAAVDGPALDGVASAYLAELQALAPGARRIVDKMPGNFRLLGFAHLLLPGARFIHCARDPRDIGLSIFTFRFHGHHPYAHDLADLGWYIGEHDRLMRHWHSMLSNKVMTVHLQDWVDDFAGTLDRVLRFLDLPPDPACERFYESGSRVRTVSRSQVRQPVNTRGIGRWRPHADALAPMIAELERADVRLN